MASVVFDPNEYVAKHKNWDVAIEEARQDLRQIMADLKFQTYFDDYIQKNHILITFSLKDD